MSQWIFQYRPSFSRKHNKSLFCQTNCTKIFYGIDHNQFVFLLGSNLCIIANVILIKTFAVWFCQQKNILQVKIRTHSQYQTQGFILLLSITCKHSLFPPLRIQHFLLKLKHKRRMYSIAFF